MERPRRKHRFSIWAVALAVLLLACLCATSLPVQIYRLLHRGLRRHGFDLQFIARDRRGLGVKDTAAAENPVTMSTGMGQLVLAFGAPFYRLFVTRDRNLDGFLDPDEFREFYQVLAPASVSPKASKKSKKSGRSNDSVVLTTEFEPLLLSSLTKETSKANGSNLAYLRSLIAWRRPHRRISRVSEADLIKFLWPPEARKASVGQPYSLLPSNTNSTEYQRLFSDSANRYYPPVTFRFVQEAILANLLSAFHPRAFPYTRYPPSSSSAVIIAANNDRVKILFRLHVEFQLAEPPEYPFWFTPSFFLGEAVLDRNTSRLHEFHMDIPKERLLNVDMEWIQVNPSGNPFSTNVEVDIGYVPKMALSLRPADDPSALKEVSAWTETISKERGFRLLESHLYPFKKIEYTPFTQAFERAAAHKKLVHSVVLWGSLDDQSC